MEGRTVFQIAALDIECCVESAHTQNLGLTALHLKYVTCHDTSQPLSVCGTHVKGELKKEYTQN